MIGNLPELSLHATREAIRIAAAESEQVVLERLRSLAQISPTTENAIWRQAQQFVIGIREKQHGQSGIDALLQEFSLSSEEGVVLMCLAEALLRIPDDATQDRMIQDRLGSGDWSAHLGHSDSVFVNASAWGLLLTGKVISLSDDGANLLSKTVSRLGEPVIRSSMRYAMQIMGAQFVMGSTIDKALKRAKGFEEQGYCYSYDMLGEGARTMADAERYFEHYLQAIHRIGSAAGTIENKPGISVKLSALHPRYELKQHQRVRSELVPRLMQLVMAAKQYDIGLTVDAEESFRLDLSLDVIETVFSDPALDGWEGFGLAIQAYQKHGLQVVEWAVDMATRVGRRLCVRLVKGAYWDSEIKWAQEQGYDGYPVFTEKSATDVSYQACVKTLLANRSVIYPQFATHNALTLATILALESEDPGDGSYEFQRLHGMGEELYDDLVATGVQCRIYAPVGRHADLLAYLVRRLLENGANTSFVNNIQNRELPLNKLLEDPVRQSAIARYSIPLPGSIYEPHRANSRGLDLEDFEQICQLSAQLANSYSAADVLGDGQAVTNPANPSEIVGYIQFDGPEEMSSRLRTVVSGQSGWASVPVEQRAEVLLKVADRLEAMRDVFVALCLKEAGKTLDDAVAEVREAIDFCRYYAAESVETGTGKPLGTVLCISPWNFPLAIFLGQVSAALVTGNTVIAKPAEQTSLIAARLVELIHACGVPEDALQVVVSTGGPVSDVLVSDARVSAVMFTGSSATARLIAGVLNNRDAGDTPLIAETGGLNAMIVDSTALAEQVVDDVIASAFHSAGQRCSALRVLYVQEDVAEEMIEKISGKMLELIVDDPVLFTTDVGPIIDEVALSRLKTHIEWLDAGAGKLLCRSPVAGRDGHFLAPAFYELVEELNEEVFGPILHLKRFRSADLEKVVNEINATGYGLTLGVHSRIESRCSIIAERVRAGNVYVNRNMVGAVVGVQPFGGRGKSGTGPKAGGPNYLRALQQKAALQVGSTGAVGEIPVPGIQSVAVMEPDFELMRQWRDMPVQDRIREVRMLVLGILEACPALDGDSLLANLAAGFDRIAASSNAIMLPSPTGETNRLSLEPRGLVSIVGGGVSEEDVALVACSLAAGNLIAITGMHELSDIVGSSGVGSYVTFSEEIDRHCDAVAVARNYAWLGDLRHRLLAEREDLLPIITGALEIEAFFVEKTVTIDTTAAGGNASLMAGNR